MHSSVIGRWQLIIGLMLVSVAFGSLASVSIVPKPASFKAGAGGFQLREGACISSPSNARAVWIAQFLGRHLSERVGLHFAVNSGTRSSNQRCVTLRYDSALKSDGGYELDISSKSIVLSAANNHGLFWAAQTLRQISDSASSTHGYLPAVHIVDSPSYRWRGLMLDVARTFYPVSFIERQISLMSYYKLNVLHLHLTDDQGWRIEIKRYPKLTAVGAWRTEPDGKRYGGFYTQEQMRSIIKYAADRNVMVVPEIEMPGHTSAAIAAYPKLACDGKRIDTPTTLGTTLNTDCVGNEYTYHFLEDVLREVAALFPSPYIHIGTDEVPKDSWQDCESCSRLATAQGFNETQENLQSYFVARIDKFVRSLGKTPIGWDEALEGRLPPKDMVIEAWRSSTYAPKVLANGNKLLVAWPYYLSTPIRYMTLRSVYDNNPFEASLLGPSDARVLGGEAALWTNHPPASAEARLYPRLLAVAEHLWNRSADSWPDFLARVSAQVSWLRQQGVAVGPADADVARYRITFVPKNDPWNSSNWWRLRVYRGFDGLEMHYSLGAGSPSASSPSFARVLELTGPASINVAPFRGARMYQAPERFEIVSDPLLGVTVGSSVDPASGRLRQLTDGLLGETNGSYGVYTNRRWVRWPHGDFVLSFALPEGVTQGTLRLRFLQDSSEGAWVPRDVRIAASRDGVHWENVGVAHPATSHAARGVRRVIGVGEALPSGTRFVEIKVSGLRSERRDVWMDEITLQ